MKESNLPSCLQYSKYLNIAVYRFKITINEARKKYGLYTVKQWEELLNYNTLFITTLYYSNN